MLLFFFSEHIILLMFAPFFNIIISIHFIYFIQKWAFLFLNRTPTRTLPHTRPHTHAQTHAHTTYKQMAVRIANIHDYIQCIQTV